MTQILLFVDDSVMDLYGQLESGIYGALKAA
jgi:hypothetical protein